MQACLALHFLNLLSQFFVLLNTFVARLDDDALVLLQLEVDLLHEALVVALKCQEATACGIDGRLKSQIDRSHIFPHVGVRCGKMAADLQHLSLLVAYEACQSIRNGLHLTL